MRSTVAQSAIPRWRRLTLQSPALKPLLLLLCLTPMASLLWRTLASQLGPNPEQTLLWSTGLWALRLLWITLSVTPLRVISGWSELARLRRMLGLTAFGYACLHFTVYFSLVQGFDVGQMLHDATHHTFVLAGMAALILMLALAVTSTDRMIKRLGGRRWRRLHQGVYVCAALVALHFWWGKLAKHNTAQPDLYAMLLAALLAWRGWRTLRTHGWLGRVTPRQS